MLAAVHDTVFVCEGEKDADALTERGFTATTASEGAGKWTPDLNRWFEAKTVYVLADNDKTGADHARQVAENLHPVAASVRIVNLPGLPHKGDVSDWLAANDPVELVNLCETFPVYEPEAEPEPDPTPEPGTDNEWDTSGQQHSRALPGEDFDTLKVDVGKEWMLKRVMARGETSSWIGGPGKCKSALLTSLAVHVAAGLDWRGYKGKGRFGVIYLAFERGDLLKRRLEAYKRKHGFQGLPILVVTAPVDLMKPDAIEILTDTIQAAGQRFGVAMGLLILDTFAKAIAFGGGDEDKAKDQNRVLGHLRSVQQMTGVHIALVGHTGKDESRGARGSNAHLGDADLMVQFNGDAVKNATITKANDQPEGPLASFEMEPFDFGEDEDGEPISTWIVSDKVPDQTDQRSGPSGPRLSDQQRVAFDALKYSISEAGERPPASNHIPSGATAVKWDVACRYLDQAGITSSDDPRRIYDKIRDALKAKKIIGFWRPWLWISDQVRTTGF